MGLCWFCGEQEGTEEIRDPNEEQELGPGASKVMVCWECARYVEWAKNHRVIEKEEVEI